ncbi:signal peptidase I [Candidatus Gracilibacteria bacterium]|nr:signal peptidase I [Candidatus Gracilibacteria bacterium]
MKKIAILLIPIVLLSSCVIGGNEKNIKSPQLTQSITTQVAPINTGTITNTGLSYTLSAARMAMIGVQMKGSSMAPTINDQDLLDVTTNLEKINRGTIVVFHALEGKYIKRIIGLSGETIKFSSGIVLIREVNSNEFIKLDEPYLGVANINHTYLPEYITEEEFTIPKDAYWVMGDNRQNSADSRQCFQSCFNEELTGHFLKKENIYGIVIK